MSEAIRCDHCGNTSLVQRPDGWARVSAVFAHGGFVIPGEGDICPDCSVLFIEWMRVGRKEDTHDDTGKQGGRRR